LRPRFGEATPNALGKVRRVRRQQNPLPLLCGYVQPLLLENAQALKESLASIFAKVREADLLLQPRT
jgi:hypothetical protein